MVHAVCRLSLRDRMDAEDAAQQTFLSAYRSLLGGREPKDPPAWLATIARNECSRVRKQHRATVPIDDTEAVSATDVATTIEQREEIEALATALSELAPSQRDAVVLREFYGLSYAEVAAVLGVSGPAVESLLFKGRKRLQEKLGSLRVASAVMLPDTIRDTLAEMLPGFGSGSAAAGTKLIAFPAAAKIAALAVVVTGSGVTVADTVHRDAPRPTVSRVSPSWGHSGPERVTSVAESRPEAAASTPKGTVSSAQRRNAVRRLSSRAVVRENGRDDPASGSMSEEEHETAERTEPEDKVPGRADGRGHEDEAAVREREEGAEAPEDDDEGKARDDEADGKSEGDKDTGEPTEPENDDTADSDADDTLED